MSEQVRHMVELTVELVFLGGLVLIVVLAAAIGRNNVNTYAEQQALRPNLVVGTELTRSTVGFYELTDIIDFYTPTIDVIVTYVKNNVTYSLTFTSSSEGGRAGDGVVRLLISMNGGTAVQYRRASGVLYRDGLPLTVDGGPELLAADMGLAAGSLKELSKLPGNGMLGYEFTQVLFRWAEELRFACTVVQFYDTTRIDSILLQLL